MSVCRVVSRGAGQKEQAVEGARFHWWRFVLQLIWLFWQRNSNLRSMAEKILGRVMCGDWQALGASSMPLRARMVAPWRGIWAHASRSRLKTHSLS